MMIRISSLLFILGFACFPLSCEGTGTEKPEENFERESGEPVNGVRIAWDYSSMQRIAPQKGRTPGWTGYPRIRRLSTGDLLAIYEKGGSVEIKRSSDEGETWSAASVLFQKHVVTSGSEEVVVNKANGELIELVDGVLIAGCNYRPAKDGITPFAIAVKRSLDKGLTWMDPEVIYQGGKSFQNGCWEPSFLQLPSGEVHVYFANEAPYTNSDEQEISMLRSMDKGENWSSDAITACFREGFRDGMPVPVISGEEILLAIEDNVDGQFKPWIVRTELDAPWKVPVGGQSAKREAAHKQLLPTSVYAGAPYLLNLPSGESVLSYQTTGGRSANWELSTMEVAVSDKQGRNFSKLSRPFTVPLNREAKWNSISLWDKNTVVAAATTNFQSSDCEVWSILGHIIPELTVENKNIQPDGQLGSSEWIDDFPIFIGHNDMINMKGAIARNEESLFFAATIQSFDHKGGEDLQPVGVRFFIDAGNYCLLAPDTGLYSIQASIDGKIKLQEGRSGKWLDVENEFGIMGEVSQDEEEFFAEVSVPLTFGDLQSSNQIRVNMQLIYTDSEGNRVVENLVNAEEHASNTWCSVLFQ